MPALFWIFLQWHPGHFLKAGICYLQPLDPCAYWMPSGTAFHGVVKLKGACSTKEQPCFMFHCSFPPCNFLVIYVGILLILDVFVSVVQIHDSDMHRCLFILFGFISTYRWLQCIHQLSYAFQWLLFDHLFDIYYCVYINSKLLISPTDSEGWGLCRGQQALLVHCGGTWPASCPQVPQPQNTPALVHKPSRLQGWDTSPDGYGLRG